MKLGAEAGVVCATESIVAEPFTICATQSIHLMRGACTTPARPGGSYGTPDGAGAFTKGRTLLRRR